MTSPCIFSRKLVTSISSGIRTQMPAHGQMLLGVKTPFSNTLIGVSNNGGELRCKIRLRFCGKVGSSARAIFERKLNGAVRECVNRPAQA